MVQQAIQQGGNTGGIGKDLVPFFKRSVGRQDHGLAFVAAIAGACPLVRLPSVAFDRSSTVVSYNYEGRCASLKDSLLASQHGLDYIMYSMP
jgi:hypothetical protein